MKHTPEPAVGPAEFEKRMKAHEEFTRAAVNACKGIPTSALEADVVEKMKTAIDFALTEAKRVGLPVTTEYYEDILNQLKKED